MANIADIIEEYIKARLNRSNSGTIIFRRSELAEKFQCVPSQINYVLSTRFSCNRGYIVETRRGGGGFVRIIRMTLEESEDIIDIICEKVGSGISFKDSISIIRYLYEEEVITKREAHLMEVIIELTTAGSGSEETDAGRAVLLKAMLMVLLRHKK
ncbi:MAG: CtsR family transcriptional regulator [Firmicutes bacterium HGW-Firmicutes-14]|nr:MAG: CtsR family transcriptional regulator [Firmicutes bacterium HGW-Firmicutes-14]